MIITYANNRFAAGDGFQASASNFQQQSDLVFAALPGGGFVAVWMDQDGFNNPGIKAQLYDVNGVKIGAEWLVNADAAGDQIQPSVTALASGGFVVTYTTQFPFPTSFDIVAQIYDASGARAGGAFVVNTRTTAFQTDSSVASLSGGGFVVTWQDRDGDGSGQAVKAQIFDGSGARVGGEFLVNTITAGDQFTPVVTGLIGGGFVVTWTDYGLGQDSRAQVYSADGTRIGQEIRVNTTLEGFQDVPVVAALPSGGFVVAWRDLSATGGDPSPGSIKFQIFGADGAKIGGEVLANTTTEGGQEFPQITSMPSGGFLISWRSTARVGSTGQTDVVAQLFDSAGSKIGGEIQVNAPLTPGGFVSGITALQTGGFVVGWTTTANSDDVAARVFFPVVNGSESDDSIDGSPNRDFIRGLGGNDRLSGGGFGDQIDGGDGNDAIDGGAGDDVLDGGAGRDALYGDAGNDIIDGGADADFLHGGNGDDLQRGGAGDDRLEGHAGNDALYGDAGDDFAIGGAGDDLLVGGDGDDIMGGESGADRLDGGVGADALYGDDGDDRLIGGAGDDILHGGAGFDTGSYEDATMGARVDLGRGDRQETGHGADLVLFVEALSGSRFADLLVGDDGINLLFGNDGDDVIGGRSGDDRLEGGNGRDQLYGDGGNDLLLGGADNDRLFGSDGDDVIGGERGDDRIEGEAGADQLYGDGGNDFILGGSGADLILGGADADMLYGLEDNDIVGGGSGADFIDGGNGDDALYGDAGDDIVGGNAGNDRVVGGAGRDMLYGDAGNDFVLGGSEADLIYAGEGDDIVGGEDGDDRIEGGAGRDALYGDGGADFIIGGGDADLLHGGAGDDIMGGESGDDRLEGADGRDALYGDAGNDVLVGGAGGDFLHGGQGADRFVLANAAESTGPNFDTLLDFGGEDRIDLPVSIVAMNSAVTTGSLTQAGFDSDLSAALGAAQLSAGNAVVFRADAGDMAGRTFLVADGNGIAGYQAGEDFVFELAAPVAPSDLTPTIFV